MPAFRWDIKHFPTVAAFRAYLATIPAPNWAEGIAVHHTYIPTVEQWRGRASMQGMGDHYRDVLHWDSGPQVFAAPDGIWQGTPVNQMGVHAGPCNDDKIAVEVVGNYDRAVWSGAIKANAEGAIVALLDWLKKPSATTATLVGHRDCMPGQKTCPGAAIKLPDVRKRINELRAASQPPAPPADRVVIGVLPADQISLDCWMRFCARNGVAMGFSEREDVYRRLVKRQVDASWFGATWAKENGTPVGTPSLLQAQTHCPFNIKAASAEWRPTVTHNGAKWHAFEDVYSGCLYSVEYAKRFAWQYRRYTVLTIADLFMREKTTTDADVREYADDVLATMAYIRSH